MKRRSVLFGLLATLAGCTAAEFRPSPGAPEYRRFKGRVEVLASLPAAEDYESLGVVIVTGSQYASDASLHKRAVAVAADRGANAVVWQGEIKLVPYKAGALQKKLGAFALRVEL